MPPLDLASSFIPGLGPGQQFVVGATNLGVTVVIATLGANTNMTAAQLIAAPPNAFNSSALAFGPVIHSLGVPPSFVSAMPVSQSVGPVSYVYITADNSAAYIQVYTNTAGTTGVPAGIATRVVMVR